MNFDSIEGLNEKDINNLFDDETEKSAEWFGTYCKTFYNFKDSACANAFNKTFSKCPIHCEDSINFTHAAMQAKCNSYSGGTESFVDVSAFIKVYGGDSFAGIDCHFWFHYRYGHYYYNTRYIEAGEVIEDVARCTLLRTR